MELISMFEKNGITYVKADDGSIYELKLVKAPSNITTTANIPETCDDIELKNKITRMLQELKVPNHYTCYVFLIDCLYFTIKYEQCRENLLENLYPRVGKLHGLKTSSIANSFTNLICTWSKTKEYDKLFDKKYVGAKKFILGLTNYFLSHYQKK